LPHSKIPTPFNRGFFMQKIKKFIITKSVGFYINALSFWNPKKATLLAYQLFSNPRDGRLSKDNLPVVLQDAETQTVHLGDDHFQIYTWKGSETVTLLVHGWESNASRWEKLLPHLKATGNTIVAIDAPAHGLSSGDEFNVPQYARFIDTVVKMYRPKHIIGHSIGGISSVYYQHYYNDHGIEKMVLLGAPSDFKILMTNYVSLLWLNNNVQDFLFNNIKEKFQIDVEAFSGRLFLKNTKIKGIIAHDLADDVVAFSEAQKLAEAWKGAEFIQTSGLGHSMHDEDLYVKITAFLGLNA
jgi:predicted alpha/beta hydrolase family esterase